MYINPFLGGVLVTLIAEIILIIVWGIYLNSKGGK